MEKVLFFIIILIMYLVCIFGNLLTVILVEISSSLHLPMYFFISVFSVSEMLFVSVTVPKLLVNLIVAEKYISFTGCFLQLFIYSSLGATECCLLAVMAFDRDLAINLPLAYGSIMTHNLCVKLVIIPWFFGFGMGSIPTLFMVTLNYCGPNVINHFFCDLAPLQSLSCSNPFRSQLATTISAAFGCVVPFIFIMAFYFHIFYAISKIRSIEGKAKAFSTCSSHLIATSLFYGTIIIVYIRPQTSQYDKYLALIYTVVVPLLNPFIYTLRNKEIKLALVYRSPFPTTITTVFLWYFLFAANEGYSMQEIAKKLEISCRGEHKQALTRAEREVGGSAALSNKSDEGHD
ncbi:olfactory receptor 5P62-like [Ranitomeya imitator]|uniref:olfactory receptor 5P62-like n=1 Tax=Ranitomeya imitator TaxID=111125 RepID=UPI0037E82416